jgi:hypothetical protein
LADFLCRYVVVRQNEYVIWLAGSRANIIASGYSLEEALSSFLLMIHII